MAEYGVGLRWGIHPPNLLEKLAVAGKPGLKPIYLTKAELLPASSRLLQTATIDIESDGAGRLW